MSKILKLATEKDASVIYQFVKLLAKTHGKDGVSFSMSENLFIDGFRKRYFNVHLFKENEHEINGILLHMKEYSIKLNGFGTYLDDFYLDPTLRGKGLGKRMLSELCNDLLKNGQKFIKVVFNKNLDLDNFYNHLGFVNQTDKCSMNLYEGIGQDLDSILKFKDTSTNDLSFKKIQSDNLFPIYEINVREKSKEFKFCCQFFFNSWLGFGLLFSDFHGETEIVRLSDFKSTVEYLLNEVGWNRKVIKTLWWHVLDKQKELGKCILSCEAENLHCEGWKVSILDQKGMEKLAGMLN